MQLSYMLKNLKNACLLHDCNVEGIAYDSRLVQKGYLFVAIKGYRLDGHSFVEEALERGASGVVAEKSMPLPPGRGLAVVDDSRLALSHLANSFYLDPSENLLVVGVTGTKGKTTVCHMIKAILEASGHKTGLTGTVHSIVGDNVTPVTHTTAESLELLELQKRMVDEGCTAMVMEVSSHALALSRVSHVKFDIGVFTNIGTDHLDFHKTLQNYVQTKGKLFTKLGQSKTRNNGYCLPFAVLNKEDPYCSYFTSITPYKIITYGFTPKADVFALDPVAKPRLNRFTLGYKGETKRAQIGLPGRFNIENGLAAAAVGLGLGMSLDEVAHALKGLQGVRGRVELVPGPQKFTVWVDYAHTPESLLNILTTAKELSPKRIIVVFGCGGDRDKHKRSLMGRIAGNIADVAVITNDNPRTENPQAILDQIETGILEAKAKRPHLAYVRISDRRTAICEAISQAQKGDIVIIAGKGHETYQILGDERIHFNDVEEAKKAIEAKYT